MCMKMHEHRDFLKNLCQPFFAEVESKKVNSINEALAAFYAVDFAEVLIFKTYEEWGKDGFFVKKGEKAFLFWGMPEEKAKYDNNGKIISVYSFCPISFKFNQLQVSNPKSN